VRWDALSAELTLSQCFEHDDRACRGFACWDCRVEAWRWADDGGPVEPDEEGGELG
jgi:hypothetical protein